MPLSRPQRIWCQWVSDRVGPPKSRFGHRLWSDRGGKAPYLNRLFFSCDACCNRITRQPRFVIFYLINRDCIPLHHSLIAIAAITAARHCCRGLQLTRQSCTWDNVSPRRRSRPGDGVLWSPPRGGLRSVPLPPTARLPSIRGLVTGRLRQTHQGVFGHCTAAPATDLQP